jgi:hypothetical protein
MAGLLRLLGLTLKPDSVSCAKVNLVLAAFELGVGPTGNRTYNVRSWRGSTVRRR